MLYYMKLVLGEASPCQAPAKKQHGACGPLGPTVRPLSTQEEALSHATPPHTAEQPHRLPIQGRQCHSLLLLHVPRHHSCGTIGLGPDRLCECGRPNMGGRSGVFPFRNHGSAGCWWGSPRGIQSPWQPITGNLRLATTFCLFLDAHFPFMVLKQVITGFGWSYAGASVARGSPTVERLSHRRPQS